MSRKHPPRLISLCGLLLALTWVDTIQAANAQVQPPPAFAVATVKPSDPNRSDSPTEIGYGSGSFTVDNLPVRDVIKFAYHLGDFADQQVVGGPGWINTARFNIVAKLDPETYQQLKSLPAKVRDAQEEDFVRTLLADRFHLKIHYETRTLSVYHLVLAKGGSKLTKVPSGSSEAGSMQMGGGFFRGKACDLATIADALQSLPEVGRRLILDKTELTGTYDFYVQWTPDPTAGIDPPSQDSGQPPNPAMPSFFIAIQEQLGLKLVPAKGAVDIVVIDHADLPSQN